jgi:hypothetical protein
MLHLDVAARLDKRTYRSAIARRLAAAYPDLEPGALLSQYPKIFKVLTPTRCARFPLSMRWRGG